MVEYDRTRAGSDGEVYVVCPYCSNSRRHGHQKEKKLAINIQTDKWRCNHCGIGGHLLSEQPDRKKGEYIAFLRRALPMELEDHEGTQIWNWYTQERRISMAVALAQGVYVVRKPMMLKNFWDKAWEGRIANQTCLAFPYLLDDAVVNCQYRDQYKNFTMEKDADRIFYNINSLKGKKKVIITEGMVDVHSVYTALGLETDWAVVSVPNGCTISDTEREVYEKTGNIEIINEVNLDYFTLCWDKFKEIEEFCFGGDIDAAGLKLKKSFFRMLSAEKTRITSEITWNTVISPEGKPSKDANDVLRIDPQLVVKCIEQRRFLGKTYVRTAEECQGEMMSHYFNGFTYALKPGWPIFDIHFGIRTGDLVIGNGWPGSGKSSFLANLILAYAWHYNWKFLLWMPENYPESLVYEWLAEILMNRSMNKDSEIRITIPQLERATKWIHEHFFCIEEQDEVNYTPEDVRNIAKRMVFTHGINALVIDPWNSLLEDDLFYKMGSYGWLKNQLTIQKSFSRQYGITTFIMLHPTTPDVKDKKGNDDGSFRHPTVVMADGGKIWWAKADVFFTIHRPNFSNQTDNATDVYVQKLKTQKLYGVITGESNPVRFLLDCTTGRFTTVDGKFCIDSSKLQDDNTQQEIVF